MFLSRYFQRGLGVILGHEEDRECEGQRVDDWKSKLLSVEKGGEESKESQLRRTKDGERGDKVSTEDQSHTAYFLQLEVCPRNCRVIQSFERTVSLF